MALFDDLTTLDPVTSTQLSLQQEQQARDDAELANLQQGLSFRAKLGSGLGMSLGKGLGRGLAKRFGIEQKDPRLEEAEKQAALTSNIQGLTQGENALDPNSAEFARSAAQAARAAGRDDLALKFITEASTRAKSEAVNVAKTAAATRKAELEEIKVLPEQARMEVYAKSPELLKEVVKDPRKRVAISKAIEEQNNLRRAKAAKTLAEVKKSTATKPSGNDVAAATSIVDQLTQGQFTDDGILEPVSRLVADRAQTKANRIKDAGGEIDMTALMAESFEELKTEGVVTHTLGNEWSFGGFITGEKLDIDREKLAAPKQKRRVTLQ